MEGRRAPKDAGLHAVQALLPLTRGAGRTGGPRLLLERVGVLLDAQLVQRDVGGLLLPDVLRDGRRTCTSGWRACRRS